MNVRVWDKEEEEELVKLYRDDGMDVIDIAEYFGKNNRSIISKLVQLKVYRKPEVDKSGKRSELHRVRHNNSARDTLKLIQQTL